MGLLDDYKSSKNREIIMNAFLKMMKNKYNIDYGTDNISILKSIVNNVITNMCNDIILVNGDIKLGEVNNMTLVKLREYIDKNPKLFQIKKETDITTEQLEDDDIFKKLMELEETRKISALLLQDDYIQSPTNDNISKNIIDTTTSTTDNITQIISKITEVTKKKEVIKTLIINSYNRDWYINPLKNYIQFNINIDLILNYIQPFKILFPLTVKNITPYIIMIITDNLKTQKFNFIFSKNNGKWDEWILMNTDNTEYINLSKNIWKISFCDFLNNELSIGCDDITITDVNNDLNDLNNLLVKLSPNNLFDIYNKEKLLIKTQDDICNAFIEKNQSNEFKLSINKEIDAKTVIKSKILDIKTQYSIVLLYSTK